MRQLLRQAKAHELSPDAVRRLKWFVYLLDHRGNRSQAARHFDVARSTIARWSARFDPSDPLTLEDRSRAPRRVRAPETDARVVAMIRDLRKRSPTLGKVPLHEILTREHGIAISISTVGRIISRHKLFFADTSSHREKRGAPLDGEEGITLSPVGDWRYVCGDAAEHGDQEAPRGIGEMGTSGVRLAAFFVGLLACLTVVLSSAPRVEAAQSASFRLYDEFPNYAERQSRSSVRFRLNEDGITWERKPLVSGSFRIVTAPPAIAAAEAPVPAAGEPPADHGGSRGPRGREGPAAGEAPPAVPPSAPPGGTPVPPVRPPRHRPPQLRPVAPPLFMPPAGPMISDEEGRRSPIFRFFDAVDPACPVCPVCAQLAPSPTVAPFGGTGTRGTTVTSPQGISDRRVWASYPLLVGFASLLGFGGLCFRFGTRKICLSLRAPFARVARLPLLLFLPLVATGRDRERRGGWRHRRLSPSRRTRRLHRTLGILVALLLACVPLLAPRVSAAAIGPQTHVYNGHLLSASGQAIVTAHAVRFSYWKSADYVSGDVTATGAINTAASTYAGWNEVHTVTPDSNGYFSVKLGSITPLPSLASFSAADLQNLFLQVEVKVSGAADVSYELLDVDPNDTAVDRSPILAVPFALNADMVDQRDVGTSSGSIPVLASGGLLPKSQVPGGTNQNTFTIDADSSATDAINLTFGQNLAKTLSFDVASDRFNFNDDVRIQGNLTVTGLINGVDITTIDTAQLRVSSGGGLTVKVSAGTYRLNGVLTSLAGVSGLSVPASTTSYVFLGSGGLTVRTMPFPTDESFIPLAEVTTSAGSVTSVVDRRALSSDDRERTVQQVLRPGYEGASFQADATNNVGQLSISHDNTNLRNFYLWTSTRPSLQDYDLLVRIPLSSDFVRWQTTAGSNPLAVSYRSTSADTAQNKLDVTVYDTNGQPVTLSGATTSLASTSWATTQVEFLGTPTWTSGQQFLIRFKLSAKDNFQIHLGDLTLRYVDLLSE